jgi:hypothetical protein
MATSQQHIDGTTLSTRLRYLHHYQNYMHNIDAMLEEAKSHVQLCKSKVCSTIVGAFIVILSVDDFNYTNCWRYSGVACTRSARIRSAGLRNRQWNTSWFWTGCATVLHLFNLFIYRFRFHLCEYRQPRLHCAHHLRDITHYQVHHLYRQLLIQFFGMFLLCALLNSCYLVAATIFHR